jgi:hypothetical protein
MGRARVALVAAMVALAGALPACEPAVATGSVQVFWEVAGQTCATAEVTDVRVHLLAGGADRVEPLTALCELGGDGLLIEAAPVGVYDVSIEGIHASGEARYEGRQLTVTVAEGQTAKTNRIKLLAKKSSVNLTWLFQNGKTCAGNKVETVEVTAFDVGSPDIVYPPQGSTGVFPCNPSSTEYPEGYVPIEPLQGNRDLVLNLFGRDLAGNRVFYDRPTIRTVPGAALDLESVLKPCAGNECL